MVHMASKARRADDVFNIVRPTIQRLWTTVPHLQVIFEERGQRNGDLNLSPTRRVAISGHA